MYFFLTYLFLPIIKAIVVTEIHRSTIYHPISSCAFLRNASWLIDASIQSCIWECIYEDNCQTAVYFNDEKICSMFAEVCKSGNIQSSGNVRASVICYRKQQEYNIDCSSTVTPNQEETEKATLSSTMMSTAQNAVRLPLSTFLARNRMLTSDRESNEPSTSSTLGGSSNEAATSSALNESSSGGMDLSILGGPSTGAMDVPTLGGSSNEAATLSALGDSSSDGMPSSTFGSLSDDVVTLSTLEDVLDDVITASNMDDSSNNAITSVIPVSPCITSTTGVASNAIIYCQNFSIGVTPTDQCTAWTRFVAQLTIRYYTLLTINGTFDPVGVSVIDSTVIANIALALRTSTAYGPVTSNCRSWTVGMCGNGYELSASGTICQCPNADYIIRPCINNENYGGMNSSACYGPSQTMTVIFQY